MIYLHFVACVALLILVAGAQTSFMHHLMGTTTHIWLAITVYMAIHRSLTFCLVWAYVSSFILLMFSYSSLSYFLIGQIILIFAIRFVVQNVFYNTLIYFIRLYILSIFSFYVITATLAYVFDNLPFHISQNLATQTIQSVFFGAIIFYVMRIFDNIRVSE